MSKVRYIFAMILGLGALIAGITMSCIYSKGYLIVILEGCVTSYAIAALIANLIWFDGPVISVGAIGFGICGTILSFIVGLTGSLLGWLLLAVIGMFLLSALAAVAAFTITAVLVVACVMFPINAIRFATDLD